ncbi:MAG: hypothetical protein ABSA83_18150 [Verrucomicrobiota bacterium]|jgi:hypothetical protein
MKSFVSVALALWATALLPMPASAQTNVLQNINLQLTIYQQGPTNSTGRKVADQVTSYTSKNLIAALESVTGQSFGNNAKLVLSTVYANVTVPIPSAVTSTILSTNMPFPTNSYLSVGGIPFYSPFGTETISDGALTGDFSSSTIPNSVLSVVTGGTTNASVSINTNVGCITTITPSISNSGAVTNVLIVTLETPTETVLTNVSSSIDVLSGTSSLYPVNNYLSIGTNSAEIVVEAGFGLNSTNALLVSQTAFSIQGLTINYYTPTGSTNLILGLQGFVKQALKLDTLAARNGTNSAVVADIFGASSTWNVNGYGYVGGTYTTNLTSVPIFSGYLTNAVPVVAEGSVSISFLKNLP